jgi:hypothetical protein
MQYSFYAASSEAVTSRRINTAAADGTFEIADIEPGTYVIQAQMQSPVIRPAPGESVPLFPTVYAVATVDVVDSDVTGVLLRLRTATLVGKVHLENQADVPATLQVQLKITNGNSPAPAVVKNDGTFEISRVSTGVPYSLSVLGLPPDMYLKEARMGTSDVRNQPLKISEASSVLNIEIGTNGGSIAGIVRRPDGRAAGGAKLTLLPRDRDRRDLFRFATSGEDGQFVFRGIPPGEYKVFAFDSTTENFAAFNEGWIRSYEQKGILLQAKPGQKETVDLVLISEP